VLVAQRTRQVRRGLRLDPQGTDLTEELAGTLEQGSRRERIDSELKDVEAGIGVIGFHREKSPRELIGIALVLGPAVGVGADPHGLQGRSHGVGRRPVGEQSCDSPPQALKRRARIGAGEVVGSAKLLGHTGQDVFRGIRIADALTRIDPEHPEKVLRQVFRRRLSLQRDRDQGKVLVQLGTPAQDGGLLGDPVGFLDGAPGEEDDGDMTLGEPEVQPVVPVVPRHQAVFVLIDEHLNPIAIMRGDRAAGILQQAPVAVVAGVSVLDVIES
jgi:hypothetical protein